MCQLLCAVDIFLAGNPYFVRVWKYISMDYEIENKQTAIKTALYFAISIWAIFVLTSYLNAFQHLPVPNDSIIFGRIVLFITGVYSLCWILVSQPTKRLSKSNFFSQSFHGFPLVIVLIAVAYLGIAFRAAYLENNIHAHFAGIIEDFVFLGLFLCASYFIGDILLGKLNNGL